MKNFVEKVMTIIKGGEEANVLKIAETIEATWKKQIKNGESSLASTKSKYDEDIEEQEERVEDAKKAYKESFLNVSSDKMTVDQRKAYVVDVYQVQISNAKNKLTSAERKLKALKEEKENRVKEIQEGIDLYKEFLCEIENI